VLSTNDANGYVWLINSLGLFGFDYNNGSGWQFQPLGPTQAFDVTIASSGVPEPGYAGLVALASLLACGFLRFRQPGAGWWIREDMNGKHQITNHKPRILDIV